MFVIEEVRRKCLQEELMEGLVEEKVRGAPGRKAPDCSPVTRSIFYNFRIMFFGVYLICRVIYTSNFYCFLFFDLSFE
jgi:hypothetical protein